MSENRFDIRKLFDRKKTPFQLNQEAQAPAKAERKKRREKILIEEVRLSDQGDRFQFPRKNKSEFAQFEDKRFGGSPLENKENREYVEELLEIILREGAIMCHSKMPIGKNAGAGGDYNVCFTGGLLKKPIPKTMAKQELLLTESVFYDREVKKGKEIARSKYEGDDSEIDTYVQNIEDAKKDFPENSDLFEEMGKKANNVMFILHTFASKTVDRGYKLPVDMLYVLPARVGKIFEQSLAKNPWLIEALSELVGERANKELQAQQFKDFTFREIYINNPKAEVFEPSISPRVSRLYSFYNQK